MSFAGRDVLLVPVTQWLPIPPDVAATGSDPPNELLPCTPWEGGKQPPLYMRNQAALTFQGVRATIKRILLNFPVLLIEKATEVTTSLAVSETAFKTEEERNHAYEGEGGLDWFDEPEKAGTPDSPWESSTTKPAYEKKGAGELVKTSSTKTERSVLPVTVKVVARINGPEGTLWTQSFEVPIHYAGSLGGGKPPGSAPGVGTLEQYVDLQNEIPLDCTDTYGLELLVYVPSSVETNVQLGTVIAKISGEGHAEIEPGSTGAVSIFYDLETGPIST